MHELKAPVSPENGSSIEGVWGPPCRERELMQRVLVSEQRHRGAPGFGSMSGVVGGGRGCLGKY